VSLVEIRGLRGGGLTSKVGRDGCDGDIDGEGGGEGGSGGFEAQGDVGGPAEWVLWDEVGRFHERVEFAVDETSDRAYGGEDGMQGVAYRVVQGGFAELTREKVVAAVVASFLADAAHREAN
jgi:hypothetical protein